jgi:succinate dehydrogenase / fumarate reductase, membrane anchor subunit
MEHSSRVWSWFLQRITALFLVIGMITHFAVEHFFRGEGPVTFSKVAARLSTPCWVTFDVVLLFAAIYHGWNGCWQIYMDINPSKTSRQIMGWLFVLSGLLAAVVGIFILVPMNRG